MKPHSAVFISTEPMQNSSPEKRIELRHRAWSEQGFVTTGVGKEGMSAAPHEDAKTFLGASGEMAARMANHPWAASPLGPPETWPLSLQTAVRIALRSRFAMWLAWGDDLTFFCNDAYLPTLGIKQDWALGQSARKVWQEIWSDIGPRIDSVLNEGISTWDEGLLLYLERSGLREETYHTFSYSPLSDDDGRIRGLLCVVAEETNRVIGERRVAVLRDLATAFASVNTEAGIYSAFERELSRDRQTIPFAIMLLQKPDASDFELVASAGIRPDSAGPLSREATGRWPLAEVLNGESRRVGDLEFRLGQTPSNVTDRPPSEAMLIPIAGQGQSRPVGVFIAALNPDRPLDGDYRSFLDLLAGQISAALASARAFDLERRRAEELAELDRAKTAFFSNVSHEFRTPLTLMLGPVEAALEGEDSTLAGESLHLVHRNALRLLKLVNTLLDFSSLESGRHQCHFEPTDLSIFTADLASMFRSATERAGLTLVVDCPPLSQPVWIDRDIWEKIVLNLLSNAYKYTLAGSIVLTLETIQSHAVLKLKDTGIGIPASELPHIFERFRRVKGANGRSHEGTGIGLALVQELVKLHGGTVTATSREGVGTEFTVTIPIIQPESGQAALAGKRSELPARLVQAYIGEQWNRASNSSTVSTTSSDDADAAPLDESRPRVLLADDSADMRDYMQRLLSNSFNVSMVSDGVEALDSIRQEKPDLVLTDVMMPRLDGFELLQAIRSDPGTAAIPVVLLSARAGEEAKVEGLRAGADDYLIKPFSARELVARITSVLAIARLRREAIRIESVLRTDRDNILESIDEGYLSINHDWRISYVNRAAEKLLGAPRSELLGGKLWAVYSASRDSAYGDELRRVMKDQVPARIENYYQPWDRWYEVSIYPAGESGINIYFRDVTERKQTLIALREADQRKDEFLATLAHELRNPLSPIRNAAEILSAPAVGSREISWTSAIIRRQVEHMARLLDDLLDISRITRGRMEIKIESITLDSVIDTALEAVRPLIESRGHRFELTRPEIPQMIEGDPVRLAQVLTNLLTNAVKYTDGQGVVRLAASIDQGDVVIEVRDSGIGLAADQVKRVFEMFSQVQSSHSRSEGGLGIGLALVKGIVELHGGTIEAESEGLGRGCRFVARLPIVRKPAASHGNVGQIKPVPLAAPRRVLIADDNRDAAESLAILLQIAGHEVRLAFSGQDAIRAAESLQPHIAFLDIGLPDISGYAVARMLRANSVFGAAIKLVAITGWGQAEDKQNALDAGFDLHFVKPANPDSLRDLLDNLDS